MSIASEITRLQTSKADSKAQINIDKDIINDGVDFINNEKVDSYNEKIAEMQEAYKQYIPTNSTSDTQIEVPKGGAIIGKTIKGNTSQNGTPAPSTPVPVNNVTRGQNVRVCGKNLFDTNSIIGTTQAGVTLTQDTNGKFELNGTATNIGRWRVELPQDIDYPITLYLKAQDNNGNIMLSLRNSLATQLASIRNTATTIISNYTPTSPVHYIDITQIGTSASYTNYKFEVMVVKGTYNSSTIGEYEPYQGKDYEINLIGKNLANPSNFKFYTQANASCSYDYDTNTLTMTTLVQTTSNNLFFCSKIEDSLLKNGKSYTISSTNVSGVVYSLKLQLRNKDGTNASKPQGTTITYDNNYSLFIVGNPFASSGSTIVPQGSVAVIKDIQVEERKCSN